MALPARDEVCAEMREMCLGARDANRASLGEVFTPVELAERMLGSVPPSAWSSEGTRVLDPAAGFGVFPALAFYLLLKGLARAIPDEGKRRRFIVERALTCVELDASNAARCRGLLARLGGPKSKPNVVRGDFLEWGGEGGRGSGGRFDLVMGNPPYNTGGLSKGSAAWADFVTLGRSLLSPRGMLLMVHPPGWRKPSGATKSTGDVWKAFRAEGSLVRLEVESARRPPFPEVDWYLWRRGRGRGAMTAVASGTGQSVRASLALGSLPFLPSLLTEATVGLLQKAVGAPGYSFRRDNRFRFRAADARGSVPHAHYWDPGRGDYRCLGLSKAQVASMTGCAPGALPPWYSSSKVVMTTNASRVPGELFPRAYGPGEVCGVTTNVMYAEMSPKEAAACVRFFSSSLCRAVMRLCQYSSPPNRKNERGVVNALRRPPPSAVRTEKSLHDFYGLTAAERELVRELGKKS